MNFIFSLLYQDIRQFTFTFAISVMVLALSMSFRWSILTLRKLKREKTNLLLIHYDSFMQRG